MRLFLSENLKDFLCILYICLCGALPSKEYLKLRKDLIEEERSSSFGGKITLNKNELLANDCLMAAKRKEVDGGMFFLIIRIHI